MPGLTDQQVEYIAGQVVRHLGGVASGPPARPPGAASTEPAPRPADLVEGVFADVDSAVHAAAAAHRELMGRSSPPSARA